MMLKSKGVSIKNISKVYISPSHKEFKAVDNITLDIKAGEFVTLLGPSGCGKTTTLRMIAGFEIPTEGEIYLAGDMINNLPPDKRDTAMVFQSYALFPHYTIFDNVAYGLKLKKLSKNVIKDKVLKILELVDLQGLENRYPNQLSGGQQQRVALARALVMDPGVLLFDEPLSNLDAKLRVRVRSEIRRIQQAIGITAIYVTHDQSEAMSLSDRVIIMNEGIIEQVGTPKEIYNKPRTRFVADFIGEANFLQGIILEKKENKALIEVYGSKVELTYEGNKKENEPCELVVRPEAIGVGKEGLIGGIITSSVFMGSYQEYRVQIGDAEIIIQEHNPLAKQTYSTGEKIKIDFLPVNVHVL